MTKVIHEFDDLREISVYDFVLKMNEKGYNFFILSSVDGIEDMRAFAIPDEVGEEAERLFLGESEQ